MNNVFILAELKCRDRVYQKIGTDDMAQTSPTTRFTLIGGMAALAATLLAPDTASAGFFEQFFGGPQPSSQPAYQYDQPERPTSSEPFMIQRHRPIVRKAVDEKPVLQKTTDLLHDKTLRPGDAVMTKSGIAVYSGHETATHRMSEFVPLDKARRVRPEERLALASMDVTRNDPLAKGAAPDTLASGRSASVSAPLVAGVKFTDQRGRTIRYIGP